MKFRTVVIFVSLTFCGCKSPAADKICDDLNNVKDEFLTSIFEENEDESPFHLHYSFRTVLFSKKVMSLFGELFVYDHLPHGWTQYESKTLCRINGALKEITFDDVFDTPARKEFIRSYCEEMLKIDPSSYFFGEDHLRTSLDLNDIHTFVVDDKFLRIIFQPYSVQGCYDGPFVISIPYDMLKDHWNPSNPLANLLPEVISSKSYTSSWDEKKFFESLEG